MRIIASPGGLQPERPEEQVRHDQLQDRELAAGAAGPMGSSRVTHTDVAGFNTFVFTGRLRHHKLKRGRYRLQAISSAGGKKSKAVTLSFRIAASSR